MNLTLEFGANKVKPVGALTTEVLAVPGCWSRAGSGKLYHDEIPEASVPVVVWHSAGRGFYYARTLQLIANYPIDKQIL